MSSHCCHENCSNTVKDVSKVMHLSIRPDLVLLKEDQERISADALTTGTRDVGLLLTASNVPFIVVSRHENDAEYARSKSALSVQANARSCKHTPAHAHTHTQACRCMHPSDVEYALSTFTFSVQATDCRGTHSTRTRWYARKRC